MQTIEAAGGLIVNQKKEILFIYRNGKWDLPKGKIESEENPPEAALREVKEETGLKNVKLVHSLLDTQHEYFCTYTNQHILKIVHWYLMIADVNEHLIPQEREGITAIQWIGTNDFSIPLNNTYPSIEKLIQTYLQMIDGLFCYPTFLSTSKKDLT